ncbi:hypothetical protein HAX54_042983 [Datura stramonium]|uniref:Uncharacterized protein n=1 Tax=Datura stramonium TaxID=4076 RepID=A0ABS8W443_DATST|nr:hypothetical protein [Datura stramonium]
MATSDQFLMWEEDEETDNEEFVPRGSRSRLNEESVPSGLGFPFRIHPNEDGQHLRGEQGAEGVDTKPPQPTNLPRRAPSTDILIS